MARTVPIGGVQPSQLYIDAARLRDAVEWFDFDAPEYEPIPTARFGERPVMLDGHTRGLLACLAGAETLRVTRVNPDEDPEVNVPLYRECVEWCRAAGIADPRDLVGRVVSRERFLVAWVARCRASRYYEDEA